MDDQKYTLEKFAGVLKMAKEQREICDGWIAFLNQRTVKSIAEIGADVNENWYGRWTDFEIRCRDGTRRADLLALINRLMLPAFDVEDDPLLFKRQDIYNKLAYAKFPLSAFVDTADACTVTFALPLPMIFAMSSFRLKRSRYAHGGDDWWGRLYLHDGRVEAGCKGDRLVTEEREFENDTTRQEMFEHLLNKVRESEASCLFTITGDGLIGAAIKAQSEAELIKCNP